MGNYKIYVSLDGAEIGPLTWVSVYVGLQKKIFDYKTEARLEGDGQFSSLGEIGLWEEGIEAGPFTWEEIELMLGEGCFGLEIPAKLDGEFSLSPLSELVTQRNKFSPAVFSRRINRIRRLILLISAAVFSALVIVLCLNFLRSEHRHSDPAVLPTTTVMEHLKDPEVTRTIVIPPFPEIHHKTPAATEFAISPERETGIIKQTIPEEVASSVPPVSNLNSEPILTPEISPTPAVGPNSALKTIRKKSASVAPLLVFDFFKISSIRYRTKPSKEGIGVWAEKKEPSGKTKQIESQPCLAAKFIVKKNIRSDKIYAKAYFFNEQHDLIGKLDRPSPAGLESEHKPIELPVILYENKEIEVLFEIPIDIRSVKWKAIVVFGDQFEATSSGYPLGTSDFLLKYPERNLVYDRAHKTITRTPAMDPLIEHLVNTRNPAMPQITLFLRPPKGVSEASEVKGVLAICVLAGSLDELKRELRKEEMSGDYNGLFSFANEHKLAILAWGSRRLWDPRRNYNELSKEEARAMDKSLDVVTDAWDRGVQELSEKYGIPDKNFLLWGNCGSAQWAARLCLRKPERFLAVHVHMPGSFDKPTLEASSVLWCVTTGENESGYERALKFVADSKKLGYPLIFKAIVGLGHSAHPDTNALGLEFFKYALSQSSDSNRSRLDRDGRSAHFTLPKDFARPAFYADIVNQEIFPFEKGAKIPEELRIPIPTKALAEIWSRSN